MVFILAGTFSRQPTDVFGGFIEGFETFSGVECVRTLAPAYCENVHMNHDKTEWIASYNPFPMWFPYGKNIWDLRHVILVCPD